MSDKLSLPADAAARRVVAHFQAEGFPGITEALIVRIRVRKGDRAAIDTAFEAATDADKTPPVGEFFEIRPYGFHSGIRDFVAARAAFQADFGVALRRELPAVFFDAAPVIIDDALATGTKYDAMLKLGNNVAEACVAILLNDPSSSFFEYLGTHKGNDWQSIMGEFGSTVATFGVGTDLV